MRASAPASTPRGPTAPDPPSSTTRGWGSGGEPPAGGVEGWAPHKTRDTRWGRAHSASTRPQEGGAEGNRTPDLLDANESRYQLRHSPVSDHGGSDGNDLSRGSFAGCTAVSRSGRAVEVVEVGVVLVGLDERGACGEGGRRGRAEAGEGGFGVDRLGLVVAA